MAKSLMAIMLLNALSLPFQLPAQLPDGVLQEAERLMENQESDADFTEIGDQLTRYYRHPLNINKAGADELLAIPLLSPGQVFALLEHRKRFGALLGTAELQVIPGFSVSLIRNLEPYIRFESQTEAGWKKLRQNLDEGKHEGMIYALRSYAPLDARYFIPDTGGSATERSFQGDPIRSNFRYRYAVPGLFSVGVSAEKDPGERWWQRAPHTPGPDFLSAHVFLENIGCIKRLALGDFQATFGQGLLMGSGLAFSHSAQVMQIKRTASGIRPFRSVNEVRFLRGAGLSLGNDRYQIHLLMSNNRNDGVERLDSNGLRMGMIEVLSTSGLHRSERELAMKNKLNNHLAALGIEKRNRNSHWGITLKGVDRPMAQATQSDRQPADAYAWKWMIASYGSLTFRNLHVFYEDVRNPLALGQQHATVAGVLASLSHKTDLALHYRNYASGYDHAESIGFGNAQFNEKGFYAGFQWKPKPKVQLFMYRDFRFKPEPSYMVSAPSYGQSWLGEMHYTPNRQHSLYIRLRVNEQYRDLRSSETDFDRPELSRVNRLRIHAEYPLNSRFNLATRLELSAEQRPGENTEPGSLLFQDIRMQTPWKGYRLGFRINYYHVPDYYARIFAFENDLPLVFSIRSFYGTGRSAYFMVMKKWRRYAEWHARLALAQPVLENKPIPTFSGMIKFKI